MKKIIPPEDAIEIVIQSYKNRISEDDIENVKNFIESNFYTISNEDKCFELEMILDREGSKKKISLGTLYDAGEEIKFDVSGESYFIPKEEIRKYFEPHEDLEVEEQRYKWAKMFSINPEAKEFIGNTYKAIEKDNKDI